MTLLQESASHESGHVLLCFRTDAAQLAFARASTAGRGTSKLLNATELDPQAAARIAVAGRVAEEVLLSAPRREVPENDGYLLTWALDQLDGDYTEEDARAEVAELLRASEPALRRVAECLSEHADADVDVDALRAAAGVVVTTEGE